MSLLLSIRHFYLGMVIVDVRDIDNRGISIFFSQTN